MKTRNRSLIRRAELGLLGLLCVASSLAIAAGPKAEVKLVTVKFDGMIRDIASKKAKLTVVDAWATWCSPCKANFHHLVEMDSLYAKKGIAFASICLDDATKPKKVAEAADFLTHEKAFFANYLLEDPQDDVFEKLDITAIPAVFMFGPDGKEVRRFTLEDPNHQFTYADVQTAVGEFLAGKPMTAGEAPKNR